MAKVARFGLKELDAIPESDLKGLRIRNVSQNIIVMQEGSEGLSLAPFEEQIVDAKKWRVNRPMREKVARGDFLVSVADIYDSPRSVPSMDSAPIDSLPETTYDRNYTRTILIVPEEEAIDMINDESVMEGGEVNVRFMKGRMLKILRGVEWAEPQVQNRKKVLQAVKEHISQIREM